MSIVHKTATAEVDGLEFVLSDATVDRMGDIVEPSGWDLKSFKRNPIALFGHSSGFPIGKWVDVRVDGGKLKGRLEFAKAGTSDRIDELRRLVEQGILKAVSVGFKPIEDEPINPKDPYAGRRFKRQELLETSLVSVPANPSALAIAKSMRISEDTLSLAFGEHADEGGIVRRGTNGEQAAIKPPVFRNNKMTVSLSKRIEDAQAALLADKDQLTAHIAEDNADEIVTEELSARIEAKETQLAALKRAESALSARVAAPAVLRKPLGGDDVKPADLAIRAAAVKMRSFLTGERNLDVILEKHYPGDERTAIVTKADATIATTTVSGWASELVTTATGDFINTLKPDSILPDLMEMGTALTFGPNAGAIRLPSRTSATSVNGDFVLEGDPIPVRRLTTSSVTLTPRKLGVISTFSKELAKYSNPQIESLLRSEIAADTAVTLDSKLLDATAGSTTRPAGLLNGVSAIASGVGGGDYQSFLADFAALMAPFDSANAGRKLALIMHPAQRRALAMMPGPDGTFGWQNQILSQFRILTSTSATANRIIAIDTTDFAAAYGGMEFDVSEQATLHMSDAPGEIVNAAGTVSDPIRSMFQTASVALRMTMDVTWAMRRTGMVQWISGTSY